MVPYVDEPLWIALTVWQEAAGEPWEGKLAVAWSIVNRMRDGRWPSSASDVVFQPLQFSAWNADSPTRMRLDEIRPDNPVWADCYKAACAAYFGLSGDPTRGANHYLNAQVVLSASGRLPSWYSEDKVTASIGRHRFLRL